ncbi:N-acetylmuramoyl-L-alanine amidase [Paludibacter sp.]
MELKNPFKYIAVFLWIVFITLPQVSLSQKKNFVVVLDAGHGGNDPGAVGRISKEKDITLAVARLVGDLISKNLDDVKVVYTRKTDVFIPLEQRATIANDNHADLFISIHVNAAKSKTAYGAETYTLGLAKTKANLDVAMTENSVILLEDDYQTKYKGFDPSSVDSYIMFEFMMDKYLDNSISFATHVQDQFVGSAKRFDRGVRQAGFWVLHRTACSSVLIELGFISHYNEELYLNSTAGQKELAQSIYNAFVKYKKNHDKRLGYNQTTSNTDNSTNSQTPTKVQTAEVVADQVIKEEKTEVAISTDISVAAQDEDIKKPVFKLQIMVASTKLKSNDVQLRDLKELDYYQENGLYKYTIGADSDFEKINQKRIEMKKRFPDAFIIAFLNGKKIPVSEAQKMIKK